MAAKNQIHYFFPHLRRGLGASVKFNDLQGDNQAGKRASIEVKLKVNTQLREEAVDAPTLVEVNQSVYLYGPGDVLGFDTQQMISKVFPQPDEGKFFANDVPFIELKEADFPWRYSSTQIQVEGNHNQYRWIPWLTLIVLKMKDTGEDGEYAELTNPRDLPASIRIDEDVDLPNLEASWRWAHVYLMSEAGKQLNEVKSIIKNQPGKAIARLFCARKLKPGTKYCAFLVPTYKLGLEAGLGQDISESSSNRMSLAWEGSRSSPGMILPYYFKWEFRTAKAENKDGVRGDFEQLVQAISPRVLENLGGRMINIDNPGYGLKHQGEELLTVEIEGALQSSDKVGISKLDQERIDNQAGNLSGILGRVNTGELDVDGEPILRVVPPIYGIHINDPGKTNTSLDANNTKEPNAAWLEQLNLDLRYRIAAGLGVRYIKENQESLMETAWVHLEKVNKENRKRNRAKFGREISNCLHKRISLIEDPSSFLAYTERIVGKLKFDSQPLERSPVDATEKKAFFPKVNPISLVINGLKNEGILPGVKPVISTVTSKVPIAGIKPSDIPTVNLGGRIPVNPLLKIDLSDLSNTVVNPKLKKYKAGKIKIKIPVTKETPYEDLKTAKIVPPIVSAGGFGNSSRKKPYEVKDQPESIGKSDLIAFRDSIKDAIRPSKTIEQKLRPAVNRWKKWEEKKTRKEKSTSTVQPELLEEVLVYPEFHDPMYKYLLSLSEEYFLPGLDQVPQNSLSVVVTNRKFIEAFLIGLNHEFASELRWRGYPTDLRGTYFRKFWDTTIYSLDSQEREAFRSSSIGEEFISSLPGEQAGLWESIQNDLNRAPTWQDIEEIFFEQPDKPYTSTISSKYEEAVEAWLLTREEDKEIATFHSGQWDRATSLGEHPSEANRRNGDANEVAILLRADLLRKFPNTLIYLVHRDNLSQVSGQDPEQENHRRFPIFEAALPPDIVILGFPISKQDAKDNYLVVFEERVFQPRLGLDATLAGNPDDKDKIENLSWEHFTAVGEGQYLNDVPPVDNNAADNWNQANHIAQAFTQRPIRMAIDLDSMLPD